MAYPYDLENEEVDEEDYVYHLISNQKFSFTQLFVPGPKPPREALCGSTGRAIYLFDHDDGAKHADSWRKLCKHCDSIARSREGGIYRTDGRVGCLDSEDDAYLNLFKMFEEDKEK